MFVRVLAVSLTSLALSLTASGAVADEPPGSGGSRFCGSYRDGVFHGVRFATGVGCEEAVAVLTRIGNPPFKDGTVVQSGGQTWTCRFVPGGDQGGWETDDSTRCESGAKLAEQTVRKGA